MRLTVEQIARATGGQIVNKAQEFFEAFGIDSRKIGQGDLIQVVVTEGLEDGEVIALNPPDDKRGSKDGEKKAR